MDYENFVLSKLIVIFNQISVYPGDRLSCFAFIRSIVKTVYQVFRLSWRSFIVLCMYQVYRLSYRIVRESYRIVRESYRIVRVSYRIVYQVFRFYRVLRLSGLSCIRFSVYQVSCLSWKPFIVWPRKLSGSYFKSNEKIQCIPKDLFVLSIKVFLGLEKEQKTYSI